MKRKINISLWTFIDFVNTSMSGIEGVAIAIIILTFIKILATSIYSSMFKDTSSMPKYRRSDFYIEGDNIYQEDPYASLMISGNVKLVSKNNKLVENQEEWMINLDNKKLYNLLIPRDFKIEKGKLYIKGDIRWMNTGWFLDDEGNYVTDRLTNFQKTFSASPSITKRK